MDFHSLTRKELQTLCKKNKIPANMTNVAMADALAALENVEGLEELMNQSQSPEKKKGAAASESPLAPHTVARTSNRRKPIYVDPEETAQPLTRTRRATRRTITINEDLDQENKNNAAETTTPAVQTRTGRRRTTQVDSTSASVQCTRRSVRLLEKTMSELSLKDKQRAEPEPEPEPVKMDSLDQTDEKKKEKDVSSGEGYLEKANDSEIAIEEESSFKSDEKLGAEEAEDVQQVDSQAQAQSQSQSCDYDDLEDNRPAVDAKAKEDVTSSADEMGLAEPAVVIPVPVTDEFKFPSETENVWDEIFSREVMDDFLPVSGDQNVLSQELESEKDTEFLPEAAADRNHFVNESPNAADASPTDAAADDQLAPVCVQKEEIASEDELVDSDLGFTEEAKGTPEESLKQKISSPCEANIPLLEYGKQMNDCDDYSVCGGKGNRISPPPMKTEADDVSSFQFPSKSSSSKKQKPDNKENIVEEEDMKLKSLNDKSLRQLTRMLKEQLQISNKNKKNNNNEEDQNNKMMRPALQTLPQNLLNNNPNKHMI